MKRKYYIYELVDPDTGETRYIGQARNLEVRYAQHLKDGQLNDKKKWLISLAEQDKRPIMRVLREVTEKPYAAEREEIEKSLEKGDRLFNVQKNHQRAYRRGLKTGRRPGFHHSKETLRKMREGNAKTWRRKFAEREAKCLEFLEDHEYLSSKDLMELLGISRVTALKFLHYLHEERGWNFETRPDGRGRPPRGTRGPLPFITRGPDGKDSP